MSSDYWTSKEAEKRIYDIPNGRLWRVYDRLYLGKPSREALRIEVRESLTPELIFSKFGLKARRGSSYWTIRCPNPDHEDKNPSCVVWESVKGFKCYSCGVSGDLVELYRLLKDAMEDSEDGD